jgi:hypothetical protein
MKGYLLITETKCRGERWGRLCLAEFTVSFKENVGVFGFLRFFLQLHFIAGARRHSVRRRSLFDRMGSTSRFKTSGFAVSSPTTKPVEFSLLEFSLLVLSQARGKTCEIENWTEPHANDQAALKRQRDLEEREVTGIRLGSSTSMCGSC